MNKTLSKLIVEVKRSEYETLFFPDLKADELDNVRWDINRMCKTNLLTLLNYNLKSRIQYDKLISNTISKIDRYEHEGNAKKLQKLQSAHIRLTLKQYENVNKLTPSIRLYHNNLTNLFKVLMIVQSRKMDMDIFDMQQSFKVLVNKFNHFSKFEKSTLLRFNSLRNILIHNDIKQTSLNVDDINNMIKLISNVEKIVRDILENFEKPLKKYFEYQEKLAPKKDNKIENPEDKINIRFNMFRVDTNTRKALENLIV